MAVEGFEHAWPASEAAQPPKFHWYQKFAAILYAFFCFEIGVFLLLFPWLEIWNQNYFSALGRFWAELWLNPYFRGAVSGLGLVDIAIAFTELFRLRRFAGRG